MTWQLRALAFLAEDLSLVSNTHVVQLLLRLQPTRLNSSSRESDVLLWTSSVLHACGTQLPAEKALNT